MNTISNINPRSPIKTETRAVELAGSCSSTFATSQNKDLADISQNWKQQVDWQVQTTTIIDQLQKSFPDIQIFYSGTMNKQELAQLAASLGKGSYLIVSEEFLTQMGSSEENFEAGCMNGWVKLLVNCK